SPQGVREHDGTSLDSSGWSHDSIRRDWQQLCSRHSSRLIHRQACHLGHYVIALGNNGLS
ncbi:hypothetical protein BgiBS90_006768, partial [Biomphalaria glabrata]